MISYRVEDDAVQCSGQRLGGGRTLDFGMIADAEQCLDLSIK
jgi:hypothetical protein